MKQNDFYAHLNEQKRKYKEKYLPYYKEYGEHLPTEILLSLKEYRQSLGMTALDVDDVIDKVKNPGLEVRRIISKQDKDPTVDISAVKEEASMLGGQYSDLIDKLAEFEEYVQGVLKMTSQLSDRCKAVTKNLSDFGTSLAQMGFKRMRKQKSGGGAAMGLGFAISALAEIGEQYEKKRIQQQEEQRLQTLLEKKQAYANASYDTMNRVFEQSQKTLGKYDELFTDQSTNLIDWKDKSRDKQFKMFEFAFFCKLKFQYLVELLDFTLQEMEAWMKGYQNSDAPYPSLKGLLDEEVCSWAMFLSDSTDFYDGKWTHYLESLITENKDLYFPIEVILFTKPYFLRNYVGVALWETDLYFLCLRRRATPVLTELADDAREEMGYLTDVKQQVCSNVKEMLSKNDYYKDCKQLITSNLKSPAKFDFFDVCVLIIMFLVFFVGTFFVMAICAGMVKGGGNAGYVMSILLIAGLFLLLYSKHEKLINLMPCIRKNNDYFMLLDSNLRDQEEEIANKYNDIKL
ncbi:unknown [Prevotella sp. CAG:255]|uniref:hypothetical protein n=1 Tax=Prevotella sp. CAG:255 TaxID=1262923 RepID=UPI00033A7C21|nr:hypothetical protein [Prevotella sp. CAG:255]CCX69093.1 unknown [Prevotella sp. CAG:255]